MLAPGMRLIALFHVKRDEVEFRFQEDLVFHVKQRVLG